MRKSISNHSKSQNVFFFFNLSCLKFFIAVLIIKLLFQKQIEMNSIQSWVYKLIRYLKNKIHTQKSEDR